MLCCAEEAVCYTALHLCRYENTNEIDLWWQNGVGPKPNRFCSMETGKPAFASGGFGVYIWRLYQLAPFMALYMNGAHQDVAIQGANPGEAMRTMTMLLLLKCSRPLPISGWHIAGQQSLQGVCSCQQCWSSSALLESLHLLHF